MLTTALIAAVSALSSGALATWITAHYGRQRTQAETDRTNAEADRTVAETAEKITGVATSLLEKVAESASLREAQLMAEVRKLEVKVDELTRGVHMLSEQIRAAGHDPVYPPQRSMD